MIGIPTQLNMKARSYHRKSIYSVIREKKVKYSTDDWDFDTVIGSYATNMLAETARDCAIQVMKDAGCSSNYRFSVKISTFYDE